MKFSRCIRCPYWWPRSKIVSGLCPDCRKKLDALATHVADQASAEAGVSLVETREGIMAVRKPRRVKRAGEA